MVQEIYMAQLVSNVGWMAGFGLILLYTVNNGIEVIVMKLLLIFSSIVVPFLMILSQKIWIKLRLFFNVVAILSALVFGNISSLVIYGIIKDKTVFMTNIHGIFLNPLFLLTGSYLGVYFIYRMVLLTLDEIWKSGDLLTLILELSYPVFHVNFDMKRNLGIGIRFRH